MAKYIFEGVDPKQINKLIKVLNAHYKGVYAFSKPKTATLLRDMLRIDPTIDGFKVFDDLDEAPEVFRKSGEGDYLQWIVKWVSNSLKGIKQLEWIRAHSEEMSPQERVEQEQKAYDRMGLVDPDYDFERTTEFIDQHDIIEAEYALETYYMLAQSPMRDSLPPLSQFKSPWEVLRWISESGNLDIFIAANTVPPLFEYVERSAIDRLEKLGGGPDDKAIVPEGEELINGALRADPTIDDPAILEVIKQPRYIAVRVTGYASADDKHHGGGSGWCTRHGADSEYIDNYFRGDDSPLYAVYCSDAVSKNFPLKTSKANIETTPFVRIAQFHYTDGNLGRDLDRVSINDLNNNPIPYDTQEEILLLPFLAAVSFAEADYAWTPPDRPLSKHVQEFMDSFGYSRDDIKEKDGQIIIDLYLMSPQYYLGDAGVDMFMIVANAKYLEDEGIVTMDNDEGIVTMDNEDHGLEKISVYAVLFTLTERDVELLTKAHELRLLDGAKGAYYDYFMSVEEYSLGVFSDLFAAEIKSLGGIKSILHEKFGTHWRGVPIQEIADKLTPWDILVFFRTNRPEDLEMNGLTGDLSIEYNAKPEDLLPRLSKEDWEYIFRVEGINPREGVSDRSYPQLPFGESRRALLRILRGRRL